MMQLDTPSPTACAALLRSISALAALKRDMRLATPAESRGWLPVLGAVCRHPDGLRLKQLAEHLHVDASVASRQFARLEEAGCVQRAPDPDDGRASLLRPTQLGQDWLDSAIGQFAERVSTLLDGWTDAEVERLTADLVRLESSVEQARHHPADIDLRLPSPTDSEAATS